MYPNNKEYTWDWQKKIGSRLDRFYPLPDLLKGLLKVSYQCITMLVILPEVYMKPKQKKCDQVSK